jgi:hypothetical protein
LTRRIHRSLTHLQPAACDRNPPIIGPMTGPSKGPNAKTAVATPRSFESNRSDTIPPPIERHAEPPSPAKRRNTSRVVMFGARAQASCHIANIAVVMSKICPVYCQYNRCMMGFKLLTTLRPYCSLKGAAMREPTYSKFRTSAIAFLDSRSTSCTYHVSQDEERNRKCGQCGGVVVELSIHQRGCRRKYGRCQWTDHVLACHQSRYTA